MTPAQHIAAQARESARELIAQGWTSPGYDYSIGTYTGDAEALAGRLGREATRNEVRALEEEIRYVLDRDRPVARRQRDPR